jgi:hypothetical protein
MGWIGAEAFWRPDESSTVGPGMDPSRMTVNGRPSQECFSHFPVAR